MAHWTRWWRVRAVDLGGLPRRFRLSVSLAHFGRGRIRRVPGLMTRERRGHRMRVHLLDRLPRGGESGLLGPVCLHLFLVNIMENWD